MQDIFSILGQNHVKEAPAEKIQINDSIAKEKIRQIQMIGLLRGLGVDLEVVQGHRGQDQGPDRGQGAVIQGVEVIQETVLAGTDQVCLCYLQGC